MRCAIKSSVRPQGKGGGGGDRGAPALPPFPGPKYFFPRKIGNIKFVDVKNIN